MKVISSQRYINYDVVDRKIEELRNSKKVVLPIIDTGLKDEEGNDLFILVDGHHRKEAAEELRIPVEYEEVKNEYGCTGERLLEACWNDSDWYYVDNDCLVW